MILLASHNAAKAAELKRLTGLEVTTPTYPEPVEDGLSFRENALIKARAGAKATGLITLADDSGLTVRALNGMPGILSARWSGTHGDDEANNRLLLAQLTNLPRDAAFVCCVALVTPSGEEYVEECSWEGTIATEPRGEGGFGYDPIFLPHDAGGKTSAELTAEEKDALSHRGQAMRKIAKRLAQISA
ncbi:RdgB/HAM1 family non-canonical purine NTP pyrophosphatase [Corynebacterium pyruviciproducens]|uniref:RdgB/HAM1 family non-canonical purine NTP pyrophosphatase n=1 Tax=Corynebacterium pyruviciproducens TaxID=598660 RepID=UPI00245496CB|nr:RdgB/HAM1 family non-canonical purine NTP pyrophosphatase [Corynebacterium pyruviciproducens]MDH4659061.1 RdgB/HAM1 family non-canonical purine NTP pyrophosphatase [Corynebacterium pyruviciproducens]